MEIQASEISRQNKDFKTALPQFETAIKTMEDSDAKAGSGILIGKINPAAKAILYDEASYCAMKLLSNVAAADFADKAVQNDPKPEYKALLADTLANLSVEKVTTNVVESYKFIQMAISNYESLEGTNKTLIPQQDAMRMYFQAGVTANAIGKANEALDYFKKAGWVPSVVFHLR